MVQGIPVRFFATPTFMGWLVEHGLTQLSREGGLVCRERWKLDQIPLPPEVRALEPVDHAWAALDWATRNMGSLDAELRFDATRIVYGLEWLRGGSDQTILTARHLAEMGGRMVPLLAYKLSSEDRPTRKLAAAALGVLGPDIEPCLPEIVAAMRHYPGEAALPLVECGPDAAQALIDALRTGSNEDRASICKSAVCLESSRPSRIEIEVLDAMIDCLEELETEDQVCSVDWAITIATRERPEVLAHVRARHAASSGLLRSRLAVSLDEDD